MTELKNGRRSEPLPGEDLLDVAVVDNDPRMLFRPVRRPELLPHLSKTLRAVIGVDEDVLAWAPEERPRYTRLGAIVICTGVMAAVSMQTALGKMTTTWQGFLLPIAIFWGLLILSLDSWMISSTHGALDARRYRMLIPRLVISVLIGAVIAEPLLLLVFAPSIKSQMQTERNDAATALRTTYANCYKPVDETATGRTCPKSLNLPESPESLRQQLKSAQEQRAILGPEVAAIQAEVARKEAFAAAECAGASGPGLSGDAGVGNRCKQDRQDAANYRVTSQITEKAKQLTELDVTIGDLALKVKDAETNYDKNVAAAIDVEVDKFQKAQANVGLLDEDRAMSILAGRSFIVFMAEWLVRLLLILIDALPVLAKILGGTTMYDRLIDRQLRAGNRLHNHWIGVREEEDGTHRQARRVKLTDKWRKARRDEYEQQDRDITELAERLRRQPRPGEPRAGRR